METLKIDPLRLLLTSTGHKPTIIINRRNNTITFHQPSSLFPSGHLQVMCGHKFHHVVKAVGINGTCDEDDGKKKARGAVGATVVLACVIGAMCFTRPMCRPALAIWPFSTQPRPETETTPVKPTPQEVEYATFKPIKPTLLVLMEQKRISNDNEITNAYSLLTQSLEPERIDILTLKENARKLALSTDRKKALDALEKVQAKFHSSCQRSSADTYPLGLVAVEMLLLQGMHPQAEDELKKLMDVERVNEDFLKSSTNISQWHADLVLFKAVISLMTNKKDARDWWDKYYETLYMPLPEPGQDVTPPSFEDFERQMKLLKNKGDELKKK